MPQANLAIIVPTINSADYIEIMLAYYRANKIPITVFVDSKTVDNTCDIASRYFPVRSVFNAAHRIGEIVETLSRAVDAKWVLRIDDDELPSLEMIRFVFDVVQRDNADVYGFCRHQCAVSATGQLMHHRDHRADDHRQWRLYQSAAVRYVSRGHSPGFELNGLRIAAAPSEACMVHLDWAVHSYQARKEKVARYDRHTPNHGSAWLSFYLHEDFADAAGQFEVLDLEEFRDVSRRIACSFPHCTVVGTTAAN